KTNAVRSDREADYFGWRGIHDYAYLALPSVTDDAYKEKMKKGFKQETCPVCEGTGMSWESSYFLVNTIPLQALWRKSLAEWIKTGCKDKNLAKATSQKLGHIKASEKFSSLKKVEQEKLHNILAEVAALEELRLLKSKI